MRGSQILDLIDDLGHVASAFHSGVSRASSSLDLKICRPYTPKLARRRRQVARSSASGECQKRGWSLRSIWIKRRVNY